MIKSIAILRESKLDSKGHEVENRVILIPALVRELNTTCKGIELYVEKDAGKKIDFQNHAYEKAGAKIISHSEALTKDLILGVKETKQEDFPKLRDNIWIAYQHFAQSKERTEFALKTSREKATSFLALETMQLQRDGHPFFPCLTPMSEAAAKIIARHADEYALLKKKIISSGLPETGLHGLKTVILGGGSVGKTAAEEFSERGCEVFLLERSPDRAKRLEKYFKINKLRFPKVTVLKVSPENLRSSIRDSFFLISAIYVAGKRPEKLVNIDLVKIMMPGGCVYPVDIDQGGGVEEATETSILEPFDLPVIPGTAVSFFAPPNIPSMGAATASEALGRVVLPYIIEIANKGLDQAAQDNPAIKSGINIKEGKIVHPGLASVFPELR
ncbi:MAG: hypothetical protein KKA31_03890 [Candidatus Margulisbacteria bacterium]|nr:hypothetical protein [Candidatus Margulisiibacteriota bacterium]